MASIMYVPARILTEGVTPPSPVHDRDGPLSLGGRLR